MPNSGQFPLKLSGCKAGAGLTSQASQYKFVKFSANRTVVLCAGATDIPCGVIQAPVANTGDPVDVVVVGQTYVQADVTLAAGNIIMTSADGQAAVAASTGYPVGVVVSVADGTAAGNLVEALVNCASPVVKA